MQAFIIITHFSQNNIPIKKVSAFFNSRKALVYFLLTCNFPVKGKSGEQAGRPRQFFKSKIAKPQLVGKQIQKEQENSADNK